MKVKVGDVFVRSTTRGYPITIGYRTYFNAELCVIIKISRGTGYIYFIHERGGGVQYTIGGGLIEKVGRFKKDYDFDENFVLKKVRKNASPLPSSDRG